MSAAPVSGAQRVAAFLRSLERDTAAELLRKLDAKVVADVAAAMTELDPSFADPERVDALYLELARHLHSPAGTRSADEAELADILAASLGAERADAVLTEIRERRRRQRPFRFLEGRPPRQVGLALAGESPSVVALVLAHLEPAQSAAVLGTLDPGHALAAVQRMVSLAAPSPEALEAVAESLADALARQRAAPADDDPALRLKTLAEVLNFAETELEQTVLKKLEEDDEQMVEEIREHMFTWNDIASIDKRAMQKLLASIDTKTLALSLKACAEDVEHNIMSNLSQRVREMVADERELAGAIPMSEVQEARAEVLRSARSLMESGEFKLAKGGDELVA